MERAAEAIREQLMVNNEEFQRLYHEHARYDAELEDLSHRRYLNDQEQAEEIRLKKLKLRTKDQMEALVHRAQGV